VAAVVGLVVLAACGSSTPRGSATYGPGVAAASAASALGSLAPATPVSSLPTVPVPALPPEAVTTLTLIAKGGPFPYSKDGVVFSNREGILPMHPSGWYHEYTVVTPGSGDRGARRVVAGKDGALFYSDDHYASFREIVSGGSS
jgi:ribonuclease T1